MLSYYQPAGDDFALWCPEDIYIDEPASLIQACLAACLARGRGDRKGAGHRDSGKGWPGGRCPDQPPAGRGARGGGCGTRLVRRVARLAGARVPVAVVRHQLLITELTALIDPADPITRVADAAVYLRPARGGLMFGGFEP